MTRAILYLFILMSQDNFCEKGLLKTLPIFFYKLTVWWRGLKVKVGGELQERPRLDLLFLLTEIIVAIMNCRD